VESRLVDVGQKLTWVRGRPGPGESLFVTVWFMEACKYHWRVIDKHGVIHSAFPTRLFTVGQVQEWMEEHRNESVPSWVQAKMILGNRTYQ